MWINPKTGKGWTDDEEAAFAELMAAGRLERLPAIRLWKRFNRDLKKALKYAGGEPMASRNASLVSARASKRVKGASFQTHLPVARLSRSERSQRQAGGEIVRAGILAGESVGGR